MRTDGTWRVAAGIVLLSSIWVPLARAEESTGDLGNLEVEVAELNRSIGELVTLVRQYVQAHRVELLMRRLELKSRGMEPMQQELREARDSLDRAEEERARLEAQREAIEEEQREAPGEDSARMEQVKSEMERWQKLVNDKLWRINQTILDLENDLARGRREIEELEGMIDEELGGQR